VSRDLSPHALMLRDTVVELIHELEALADEPGAFSRGYRMGLHRGLDVLKQQCIAFGIPEDMRLPPLG